MAKGNEGRRDPSERGDLRLRQILDEAHLQDRALARRDVPEHGRHGGIELDELIALVLAADRVAIGCAGVPINCATVDVSFNGVTVVKRGVGMPLKEREAARVLRRPSFQVKVRLGQGKQATSISTADLSHEYVRINSAYRT